MATKKKPPKKRAPAVESDLDAFPDFGEAPDPNSAVNLASDALFRFLFNKEFPDNPSPTLVRFLAMLVYTTDPQAVSLHDLSEMEFFKKHVTLEKVMRWSVEDGWGARREKTWETWHERVIEHGARRYIEFRDKSLTRLEKIADRIIDRLVPDDAPDRKFGTDSKDHEVVRALLGVLKMQHELQVQATPGAGSKLSGDNLEKTVGGKVLGPGAPRPPGSPESLPAANPALGPLDGGPMDEAEMRAAAHAVLEHRRKTILSTATPATPTVVTDHDDDEDEHV